MSVFICWSGERSHRIAFAVKELLHKSLKLRKREVFISDTIEKGSNWFNALEEQLGKAEVGIVCLTPENLSSKWLHFEAGALGRALQLKSRAAAAPPRILTADLTPDPPSNAPSQQPRLFPLLHGVAGAEVLGPLGAYQASLTTERDVGDMIATIARVLGSPGAASKARKPIIARRNWTRFQKTLERLAVPAREVVDLQTLLDRKTFHEPVYRCTDQAWLARYDGARDTRTALLEREIVVDAACSPHERALYSLLLAELNGYTMTMQSLLLRPRRFKLVNPGELKMDPPIRACCEDRRLAIKSLAMLLLHPTEEPIRDEAVRFMKAETDAERKMIVHRLEGAIRKEREAVFAASRRGAPDAVTLRRALAALTRRRPAIEYRASSWDLDRIYYYLLVQYFTTGVLQWDAAASRKGAKINSTRRPREQWLCAARDVEMEVERWRAKSKGGSLMPLRYALCALQELHRERVTAEDVIEAARSAINLVRAEVVETSPRDAVGTIERMLADLETLLPAGPTPRQSPGDTTRAPRRRGRSVPRRPTRGASVSTAARGTQAHH